MIHFFSVFETFNLIYKSELNNIIGSLALNITAKFLIFAVSLHLYIRI